jgi:hypothetical protein
VSIHPSDGADGGFLTGHSCSSRCLSREARSRSRSRAAQTLVLFKTSALIAVALVTPRSSTTVGVELVMSAVLCGAALLTLVSTPASSHCPLTAGTDGWTGVALAENLIRATHAAWWYS